MLRSILACLSAGALLVTLASPARAVPIAPNPIGISATPSEMNVLHRIEEHLLVRRIREKERAHRHANEQMHSTSVQVAGCTEENWRSTMTADETWIAFRESRLDPTPSDVNPSSGAMGLGQLLPSTYEALHIVPSWNPCDELNAMRTYIFERYGSEDAAVAFWEANDWY